MNASARARSAAPDQGPRPTADRRRWFGLFFIALGVAMIIVDATIVNVAIPQIIRSLRLTSTDAQWVQDAYTLVFAALLLAFGRLADRYGRRRLFVIGVLGFVAASVLAARAGSGPMLIGGRVAQGVGGALMLPTSLSMINAGFRGRERGVAFAVWGATIGGTAALGPLLGGWLTTAFSWRWAFAVNVPIGAAVCLGTLALVPESRDEHAAGAVDWLGAVLSALGLTALVFGLIEGRSLGWWLAPGPVNVAGMRWSAPLSPVPVAFAVAALALTLFAVIQRRRNAAGRPALLDLSLFSIPSFRNGNLAAGIVSLGEFGLLFALPLWFQNVRGYSALRTGVALLPLALGSFASSGLGAALGRKRGPLFVVRLGVLLELVGILGVGLVVAPDTPWWATVPGLLVYGAGVGLATAQLTGVVLADVPVAASGQGSGTQGTVRQIGAALGVAVLGTILFAVLAGRLSSLLAADPAVPAAARAGIVEAVKASAGAAISGLPESQAAQAARQAFSDATRITAFAAAAFLFLGLLASRSLGPAGADGRPRAEEDEGEAEAEA